MSVEFWPDGAVKTFDMNCASKCGFSGGYSGYCSQCWRGLDAASKAEATKREAELEVGRAKVRAEKEAALAEQRRAAEEASRKREREEAEEEAQRQEELSRMMTRRKADNDCELVRKEGEIEVWTCGVGSHRAPGLAIAEEPRHAHRDPAATAALSQVCEEVSEALRNVEEGSSESGAPYVGFCVSVKDNPNLEKLAGRSPRTILATVFGEEACVQLHWSMKLPVAAASLFPRYKDREDDDDDDDEEEEEGNSKTKAIDRAVAAIARIAAPGTGFTSYPQKGTDVFVGDFFLGAVTRNGDIIGAMCNLVWT